MTARERLHALIDSFAEEDCEGILLGFRALERVGEAGYERMQRVVRAEVKAASRGSGEAS